MTKDNQAARDEEQVTPQREDMSPKGGKGPTRAAAADTPGAFGDAERPDGNYDAVEETLIKGPSGPEGAGPS
jgi:hypothetical protein